MSMLMSVPGDFKMVQYINYRMRVTILDGRQLVGNLLAFDRHMNLVLSDCEEIRKLPPAKGADKKPDAEREERRTLGLVLLQGVQVVTVSVDGPPPRHDSRAKAQADSSLAGPGVGHAVGRGIPIPPHVQAPPGLAGPVPGVGGPAPGTMQPLISRPSVSRPSAPSFLYPRVNRPPSPVQVPAFPRLRSPGVTPVQFPVRPVGPPPPFLVPPRQLVQRPGGPSPQMMGVPPLALHPGIPVPVPRRPGMPPLPPLPPRPMFAPPRPGMPPPPPPNQQ